MTNKPKIPNLLTNFNIFTFKGWVSPPQQQFPINPDSMPVG